MICFKNIFIGDFIGVSLKTICQGIEYEYNET